MIIKQPQLLSKEEIAQMNHANKTMKNAYTLGFNIGIETALSNLYEVIYNECPPSSDELLMLIESMIEENVHYNYSYRTNEELDS